MCVVICVTCVVICVTCVVIYDTCVVTFHLCCDWCHVCCDMCHLCCDMCHMYCDVSRVLWYVTCVVTCHLCCDMCVVICDTCVVTWRLCWDVTPVLWWQEATDPGQHPTGARGRGASCQARCTVRVTSLLLSTTRQCPGHCSVISLQSIWIYFSYWAILQP